MAKTVQHETGAHMDTALEAVGWVALVGGAAAALAAYPIVSACLMAVARVLP